MSIFQKDISKSLDQWELWLAMGWSDIAQRYRRSIIGPFWISMSMAVLVLTIGTLYSRLFNQDINTYIPYLTAGLISWNLMSVTVSEGCVAFIEAAGFIKQIKLPLPVFMLRVIWRNFVITLHHVLVFLFVALYFKVPLNWHLLLIIPGLLLVMLNLFWISSLVAIVSARYRDLPPIINSLLQPAFFFTPIIWSKDQVSSRPMLVDTNPIFHSIEVIRAPLLGGTPAIESWLVVTGMAVVGLIALKIVYEYLSWRIPYWI